MIQVRTLDDVLKGLVGGDDKLFAVLPPKMVLQERIRDVVERILPDIEDSRPEVLFNGEAEIFLLTELVAIADKVIEGAYQPGYAEQLFLSKARSFAVTTDVLGSVSSSKTLTDTFGVLIAEALPMFEQFKTRPESQSKEKPWNPSYAYLTATLGMSDADTQEKYLAHWLPTFAQVQSPDAQSMLTDVFSRAGYGPGPQLPYDRAPMMLRARIRVEHAIRILYDPSFAFGKATYEKPMYEDAYVLAIAYIAYCYYTSTPEMYSAIFPDAIPGALTPARVARIQTSTRFLSHFYAGAAIAGRIADTYIAMELLKNLYSFMEPVLQPFTHELNDFQAYMDLARARVTQYSFSPVLKHCDFVMSSLTKLARVHAILPSLVHKYLKFKESDWEVVNQVSVDVSNFRRFIDEPRFSEVASQVAVTFLSDALTIARSLRTSIDDMNARLMYYYKQQEHMIVNELQLPADLLVGNVEIPDKSRLNYQNLASAPYYPLSVPRFSYKDERIQDKNVKAPLYKPALTGSHSLESYLTKTILLDAFRRSLLNKEGRYYFDPMISLPLGASLGYRFATVPLPYAYARSAVYDHLPADWDSVAKVLDRALTIGGPINYFLEDAAAVIAFNQLDKQDVLTALAPLALVYDLDAKDWIEPLVPTVYGVPTGVWTSAQKYFLKLRTKSDKFPVRIEGGQLINELPSAVRIVSTTHPISGKKANLAFVLTQAVPQPGKLIRLPFLLSTGAIISVPVMWDYLTTHVKESLGKDFSLKSMEDYQVRGVEWITALWLEIRKHDNFADHSRAWYQVNAFSPVSMAYPHLRVRFEASYHTWSNSSMEKFLFKALQRVYSRSIGAMAVRLLQDISVVIPVWEDVVKETLTAETQNFGLTVRGITLGGNRGGKFTALAPDPNIPPAPNMIPSQQDAGFNMELGITLRAPIPQDKGAAFDITGGKPAVTTTSSKDKSAQQQTDAGGSGDKPTQYNYPGQKPESGSDRTGEPILGEPEPRDEAAPSSTDPKDDKGEEAEASSTAGPDSDSSDPKSRKKRKQDGSSDQNK